MDCGEGSYLQLCHFYGKQRADEAIKNLKCIFVSHKVGGARGEEGERGKEREGGGEVERGEREGVREGDSVIAMANREQMRCIFVSNKACDRG